MGVGEPGADEPPDQGALTDEAWLARAGGLTAEAADDHETARAAAAEALAFRLTATAAALCAASPDPPLNDRDTAAVAQRLAAAAPSPPRSADPPSRAPGGAGDGRDVHALADAFVGALADASVAVYFCRCTQHPGGRCWFSAAGPADGLCGDVLAAAHRLAPRVRAG